MQVCTRSDTVWNDLTSQATPEPGAPQSAPLSRASAARGGLSPGPPIRRRSVTWGCPPAGSTRPHGKGRISGGTFGLCGRVRRPLSPRWEPGPGAAVAAAAGRSPPPPRTKGGSRRGAVQRADRTAGRGPPSPGGRRALPAPLFQAGLSPRLGTWPARRRLRKLSWWGAPSGTGRKFPARLKGAAR